MTTRGRKFWSSATQITLSTSFLKTFSTLEFQIVAWFASAQNPAQELSTLVFSIKLPVMDAHRQAGL